MKKVCLLKKFGAYDTKAGRDPTWSVSTVSLRAKLGERRWQYGAGLSDIYIYIYHSGPKTSMRPSAGRLVRTPWMCSTPTNHRRRWSVWSQAFSISPVVDTNGQHHPYTESEVKVKTSNVQVCTVTDLQLYACARGHPQVRTTTTDELRHWGT